MYGTDLEARLATDADGGVKAELRARLDALRMALQQQLREPCKPDEYHRLSALLHASDAGVSTIEKISRRLRQTEAT